jgi:hypothetical protein
MNRRTNFELADIIKIVDTSKGYSFHQKKAFKDIVQCRTSAMDGHARRCSNSECGNIEVAYNSCRNRACPKCGWKNQQEWILKMAENILPCKHFHTVFTIPHEFNNFFIYNKSAFSDLLLKSSAKALLDLIRSKWKVKGGYTSVLHTWGSALNVHPHVHMIVPAGGFSLSGDEWVGFRKQYIANKNALALRFRNVFMKGIKKMILKGTLKVPSCHGYLNNEASLLDFFNKPHSKKWNVHIQKTFGGETQVIKYLGRYIHRSAISNSRIIDVSSGKVLFKYKNYKSGKLDDLMVLDVSLFLRRYSHHICDKKFQRVRHGGIYGNTVKKENVMDARLKVYGDWKKPVSVMKEVWKIENNIAEKIDSISICNQCSSCFELEKIQDSA